MARESLNLLRNADRVTLLPASRSPHADARHIGTDGGKGGADTGAQRNGSRGDSDEELKHGRGT